VEALSRAQKGIHFANTPKIPQHYRTPVLTRSFSLRQPRKRSELSGHLPTMTLPTPLGSMKCSPGHYLLSKIWGVALANEMGAFRRLFQLREHSEDSVSPAMNERTSRLRSFGIVVSTLYDSMFTRRMARDCADVTLDQVFAALVQHLNFCCLINFSRLLKHQRLFPLTHPQYHNDRISLHSRPSTLPPKRRRSTNRAHQYKQTSNNSNSLRLFVT
jgi:hypothetical protein